MSHTQTWLQVAPTLPVAICRLKTPVFTYSSTYKYHQYTFLTSETSWILYPGSALIALPSFVLTLSNCHVGFDHLANTIYYPNPLQQNLVLCPSSSQNSYILTGKCYHVLYHFLSKLYSPVKCDALNSSVV